MVEFGIIISALFILTVFSVSVGINFYRYNAMAGAARYASRWASVVGGTCMQSQSNVTTADWCNQLAGGSASAFWNSNGDKPLQTTTSQTCISNGQPNLTYFYVASSYASTTSTTIVGAAVQHFDSNSGSTNTISGKFTPAFDATQLRACIEIHGASVSGSKWTVLPGDTVSVYLEYPLFGTLGFRLSGSTNLLASAQYVVE